MRRAGDRISTAPRYTPGIAGCVFDGADGGESAEHRHDIDESLLVVQGEYTVIIDGRPIPVRSGGEYVIPRGVLHGGRSIPGTWILNTFGGRRAERENPSPA
jgi:quercetin dioxygenase-like cupin family protein